MDKGGLFSVLNIIAIIWVAPLLVKIYKELNEPKLESISTEELVRDVNNSPLRV